ncbi:hypothetical protein GGF37_002908 [Kickxella alabastrina]|nr:hypothetical protein GGF37_002908 [Kickxella alabastrina]
MTTFLEELKRGQEQRQKKQARRTRSGGPLGHPAEHKGSTTGGTSKPSTITEDATTSSHPGSLDDGATTNLFIGNVHPDIDEHGLCVAFGKYGPIGSVKIMWPRTAEEHSRNRNTGFVSFMNRDSAARAISNMDGSDLGGYDLRVCWGKRVPIPSEPVFVLDESNPTRNPSTGYPFNAVVPRQKHVQYAKMSMLIAEDDEQSDIPEVIVEKPLDHRIVRLIHWTIDHVVEFGPEFEYLLILQTNDDPRFQFLVDHSSPEHVYYRWRMYSLLNGDTKSKWNEDMFFMYDEGPIWIPPSSKHKVRDIGDDNEGDGSEEEKSEGGPDSGVSSSEAEEEAERDQDMGSRDTLGRRARERLERRVRRVSGTERGAIADAMVFAIDHAYAAEDVVDVICRSLLSSDSSPAQKLCKLFLVSDILHNCSAPVANAWRLRQAFEVRLTQLFDDLSTVYMAIDARLRAENFRKQVLGVLAVWEAWMMFPEETVRALAVAFIR